MALKDVGVKLVVGDTGKFKTDMDNADKQVSSFSKSVVKNSKAIGAGLLAASAAIVAVGVLSIKTFAAALTHSTSALSFLMRSYIDVAWFFNSLVSITTLLSELVRLLL